MEPPRFPHNLNLLVVFAAVAETLSVTEAAKRLNLSQPAVSHALARLRQDMQDPLFLRRGGKLKPTARASALIGPVNQLLQDAQRIFRSQTFDPSSATRTFRLALSDYATVALSLDLARTFTQEAPGAHLVYEFASNRSTAMLLEGELDAIIWRSTEVPAPLASRTVMIDRFVVAARADHPLARRGESGGSACTVDDFVSYKHVQKLSTERHDSLLDGALERLGLRRDIAIATKDYRSALEMLPGSDLLLALPERVFRKLSPRGVVVRPLPFQAHELTYDLVWDSRLEQQNGLQWLIETITTLCGSLPL